MTPKGYFSVAIQTKPYIAKYLTCLYGNPLILSTSNSFGNIIESILIRPSEDHHNQLELKQRFDKYTTRLEFFVPRRNLLKRKGFAITDRHVFAINKFFENQFCEQLLSWCELGIVYKVEYKKNIEDFCWRHKIEIDEDITFDALQKKEYRFRQKLKEKNRESAPPVVRSKVAFF